MVKSKICAASDCDVEFTPKIGKQIYHSNACRDREKARKYRKLRKKNGDCPQCGKPMENPAKGTYKLKLSYCIYCEQYFKNRYNELKNEERWL
jgi:hypothetical protein